MTRKAWAPDNDWYRNVLVYWFRDHLNDLWRLSLDNHLWFFIIPLRRGSSLDSWRRGKKILSRLADYSFGPICRKS
jgi:hypothetical protein